MRLVLMDVQKALLVGLLLWAARYCTRTVLVLAVTACGCGGGATSRIVGRRVAVDRCRVEPAMCSKHWKTVMWTRDCSPMAARQHDMIHMPDGQAGTDRRTEVHMAGGRSGFALDLDGHECASCNPCDAIPSSRLRRYICPVERPSFETVTLS